MNIFFLSEDPIEAAQMLADRHVVKMGLEATQMLSTAHRVLDGQPFEFYSNSGRKKIHYILPQEIEFILYKASYINHPCSVWVRSCSAAYNWTFLHAKAIFNEYTHRFGKTHKSSNLLPILENLPKNISHSDSFILPVAQAMPEEYQVKNIPTQAYKSYYLNEKSHLFRWTKRKEPEWTKKINEFSKTLA